MTNYTMPVLSEQEKIHAIYDAEERVQALKLYCKLNPDDKQAAADFLLMRIALASLTAKPVVHEAEINGVMSSVTKSHFDDCEKYGIKTRKLYTFPPVPVKQEGEQ